MCPNDYFDYPITKKCRYHNAHLSENYSRDHRYSHSAGVLFAHPIAQLDSLGRPKFYRTVFDESIKNPDVLTECHCLAGYSRYQLNPQSSLRGLLDYKAAELLGRCSETQTLFFFASGRLSNETTIVAAIMSRRVSVRIVIIDIAYTEDKQKFPHDNSKELAAVHQFREMVHHLAEKFRVRSEVHVFDDFHTSLITFVQSREKISACFMLDCYFPVSYGLKEFHKAINTAFSQLPLPPFSYNMLFFFLNKKDDGEIKFPVKKPAFRSPRDGFDQASLSIFQVQLMRDGIVSETLIFEQTM